MEFSVFKQNHHETDALELISGDGCYETPRAPIDINDLETVSERLRQNSGRIDWGEVLEKRIASLSGYSDCVAVASGTSAVSLALIGSGVRPGDEVILPSYAPVSIADAVVGIQAVPILVDVEEATLLISPSAVEDVISDRTQAMIAVHVAGLPVHIRPLASLARSHRIALIEDTVGHNAGVISTTRSHRGDLLLYRFDADYSSPITHGGAICVRDPETASVIRRERLPRASVSGSPSITHNNALSQLAAVWELVQIDSIRERWMRRCQISLTWSAEFGGTREFQVPPELPEETHAWTQFLLRVNLQHTPISRTELVKRLRQRGVEAGIHYLPIHMYKRYQKMFGFGPDTFPVSRNEFLREITLPLGHSTSDAEVDRIWTTVMEALTA